MSDRVTHPSIRVSRASTADRVVERIYQPRFSPGALEAKVLHALDGVRTVNLVAQRVGLAWSETVSILEGLERLGAVRFADVVAIENDVLDDEPSDEFDRVTSPDLSFTRPTMPHRR